MKLRRTPWFDGKTKPRHRGVYEVQHSNGLVLYALWDGTHWRESRWTVEAAAHAFTVAYQQKFPWRGIFKE